MKKLVILFVLIAAFSMTACGEATPTPKPVAKLPTAAPKPTVAFTPVTLTENTPTQTAVPPTVANTPTQTVAPTATSVPPTATSVPPTATNAPTKAPVSGQNGARIIKSFKYDVVKDEADGDPITYWANVASEPNKPQFMVFGPPMISIDFENLHVVGTSYRIEANNLADATSVANAIAKENGIAANMRIFIGPAKAPDGWTKELLSAWNMRVSVYNEKAIEPGGTFTEILVSRESARKIESGKGNLYCQLWNPDVADKATHSITTGKTLVIPTGYQGTCWLNEGGDLYLLYQRFAQASAEVFVRDLKPVINKLWCGPTGGPMGWEQKPLITIPVISAWDGWDCK